MSQDVLERAFSTYPRHKFLPDDVKDRADLDMPLPIGYGQTNSQPYTVRQMLEWLNAQPGDNVLDIGSGSGWTTALLSNMVGDKGHVTAVELIPELVTMGRDHCKRAGIKNVEFHQARSVIGWPDNAPYDAILVSASATDFPEALLDQLAAPGTLVVPVRSEIREVSKLPDNTAETTIHPGFMFVPLIQTSKK